MARSFFIETFGCQMNEHDSEKISGLLVHRGMRPVREPELADLFLLNTCSVREKASQKVYSRLGELKVRKKSDPNFTIGVVGCVAQQEGEDMVKRAPFVDLVVGTHMYYALGDLLEEVEKTRLAGAAGRVETRWLEETTPVEFAVPRRRSEFRANITVMEGCNKRCSFCVVPFTRGPRAQSSGCHHPPRGSPIRPGEFSGSATAGSNRQQLPGSNSIRVQICPITGRPDSNPGVAPTPIHVAASA